MRWPVSSLVLSLAMAAPVTVGFAEEGPAEGEIPKAETESRVKDALAKRLDVEASDIRVVESEERTWPSDLLGCHARRGFGDPRPVPGYRIVLGVGEKSYVYHTDRKGRFIPCDRPRKPLDRIQ
jgi:hypothetical protein